MISQRTKRRSAGGEGPRREARQPGAGEKERALPPQRATRRCAQTLAPMAGMPSRAIAQWLNEKGIKPPRGGAWSYQTVLRIMSRLGLQRSGAAL